MTEGVLRIYPGDGDHNHLLYQPHLERNVEILRGIIDAAMARSRRRAAVREDARDLAQSATDAVSIRNRRSLEAQERS